jgi:hypothetical protein
MALLFGDHETASENIQETSPEKTQALGERSRISARSFGSRVETK